MRWVGQTEKEKKEDQMEENEEEENEKHCNMGVSFEQKDWLECQDECNIAFDIQNGARPDPMCFITAAVPPGIIAPSFKPLLAFSYTMVQ